MAVTVRRVFLLVVLLASGVDLPADEATDVHQVISSVAQALSTGDAAQAITPFSKTYPDYDKISSYFEALTEAYLVNSQVDFLSEELTGNSDVIRARWALTLTTRQSGFTINRSAEMSIKIVKEHGHWSIKEFSPISLFDPQAS